MSKKKADLKSSLAQLTANMPQIETVPRPIPEATSDITKTTLHTDTSEPTNTTTIPEPATPTFLEGISITRNPGMKKGNGRENKTKKVGLLFRPSLYQAFTEAASLNNVTINAAFEEAMRNYIIMTNSQDKISR